jgi:tRNA-Thr(GGU) m(6)t(6)A37 methyltransferase TsaA
VDSSLKRCSDAPKQADGAPSAWVEFAPHVAEGLRGLRAGDEVIVLTWLDRAARDTLLHPRDDMAVPLTGVFATRSAERPNPIGLHPARIVAIDGLRVELDRLEAIDGTPVVDLKPALRSSQLRDPFRTGLRSRR